MPIKRTHFKPTHLAAAGLISGLLLLSGCSNDEPEQTQSNPEHSAAAAVEDTWLSEIPADTPYFFASRERLSETDAIALVDKLGSLDDIEVQLAELEALRENSDDPDVAQFIDIMSSLLRTFDEVKTIEDYHQRGMMPNARSAFYGLGLLPAIRMELHDEDLFRAFFEGILSEIRIDLESADLGGTEYWHTSADAFLQTFISIKDNQVILGLLPSTVEQSVLEQLLGMTPPAVSLLESQELQQLERDYNYTAYGSGRFSTRKIVDEIISPSHPASQALLQMGGPNAEAVENCRADINRLTDLFPALVMGVQSLDTNHISGSIRLATGASLADDLIGFTTAVPGLGSAKGIASLGLGLDVQALTAALQKYAGQVRDTPFTCPELVDINLAWDELGLFTNHPMTMMLGPSLSGINVRIDSIDMNANQPTGTGVLALSSPNAQGLISAVSMFAPQIASLNLQSNGDVKQVDPSLLPPDVPSVHAAMSDTAILLGFGLENPSQLTSELEQPLGRPDLVSYGHLNDETFATLAELSSQLPNTDGMDTAELLYMAEIYQKLGFWLGIDGAGFELGFEIDMK